MKRKKELEHLHIFFYNHNTCKHNMPPILGGITSI